MLGKQWTQGPIQRKEPEGNSSDVGLEGVLKPGLMSEEWTVKRFRRGRNDGYWVKWEEAQSSMEMRLWEEKGLVREAYTLSIDHRRQDGNHSELCLCQISNRTSSKDPWWVKGLGLPWRSWLTDLYVVWGTSSLDGTSQKDLHFVPKSLVVLETGLVLAVWEASLERVTHDQAWLWLRKHHQIDYYWWSFSSVEGRNRSYGI